MNLFLFVIRYTNSFLLDQYLMHRQLLDVKLDPTFLHLDSSHFYRLIHPIFLIGMQYIRKLTPHYLIMSHLINLYTYQIELLASKQYHIFLLSFQKQYYLEKQVLLLPYLILVFLYNSTHLLYKSLTRQEQLIQW